MVSHEAKVTSRKKVDPVIAAQRHAKWLAKAGSAEKKRAATRRWFKDNPEKIETYNQRYQIPRAKYAKARRDQYRKAVLDKYGHKCASENCRWLNEDNTIGCTDDRLLQLDHVKGGGCKERKRVDPTLLYKLALNDTEGKYQLLCVNCNWIKRHVNKEVPESKYKKAS